jgi:anaerobic magnesium-protoporphyrin IX monomethyl ester cyclase
VEDIEATIRHVSTSQPDIFFTTVSYPIKGTPYYKKMADRLVQLQPWGTSSDRDLKVKGRHSQRFYSYADKLLKDEVQLARLAGTPAANSERATSLRQSIQLSRAGLLSSVAEVEA